MLDEQCVELMLRTSSPEGRRRYHEEIARNTPAHDHDPDDPRAYVIPCANTRCWRRVLVRGNHGAGRHRYCCGSCTVVARYWRERAA